MTDERTEQIVALRKEGKTLEEIAAIIGVTRQRIHQLLPESEGMGSAEVEAIVRQFAAAYLQQLRHQAGQMIPGADMAIAPDIWHENVLERCMEPQEWLTMALYGQNLLDEDAGYIYEICQGMAEWLFALPDYSHYEIPNFWADTPMGALWWAAIIRSQGDELITQTEAADILGVDVRRIGERINRGTLKSYLDPSANNPRKGRRLVRKSDILNDK